MMEFFAEKFEGLCKFLAVMMFIIYGILGFVFGFMLGYGWFDGIAGGLAIGIVMTLVGLLIALLFNIFTFGLIAQIISINNNLSDINTILENDIVTSCATGKQNLQSIDESGETQEGAPVQKQSYQPVTNIPPKTTWQCKKCGAVNSINSTSCKDCGTYK